MVTYMTNMAVCQLILIQRILIQRILFTSNDVCTNALALTRNLFTLGLTEIVHIIMTT